MGTARRASLRIRTLVAIVAAVALGVSAFGAVAYRAIRNSILTAAEARLRGVAQQLAQSAPASAVARDQRLRAAAVVREAIETRGTA
jgi:hypothetical protein